MIKFGSARISENGTVNGQRGDQTGSEVMIQVGYMHRNGWKIIRAKDPNIANGLAFSMACACNLDKVGYSQADRYAVFFTGINTIPTNADCSSLVAWCVQNVGITNFEVNGFYTGNEIDRLLGTGQFNVFGCNSLDDLYTGDILVDGNGTAHTVIVVEGKSRDFNVFDSPEPILQYGSQGEEVKKLQIFLKEFCGQNIAVDGDFRGNTKEAFMNFQRFFDIYLVVDGIYGNQSKWVLNCVLAMKGIQPV